jgi:hypothetical protein
MKSRLLNALLDLLFNVICWLLGVKDDYADIAVSTSPERTRAASQSIYVGRNRG